MSHYELFFILYRKQTKKNEDVKKTFYHGLTFSSGIGTQVKKTVNKRKDFRPQTSDRAPINGADINDRNP